MKFPTAELELGGERHDHRTAEGRIGSSDGHISAMRIDFDKAAGEPLKAAGTMEDLAKRRESTNGELALLVCYSKGEKIGYLLSAAHRGARCQLELINVNAASRGFGVTRRLIKEWRELHEQQWKLSSEPAGRMGECIRKTQTLSVDSRKVHREHRTLSLENGFRADYAKEKEFLNVSLVFRRPGGSPL